MAQKPVIFAKDRKDLERFDPERVMALEPDRIPGYTEIVKANDIAKADELNFRQAHKHNPHISTQEDVYRQIGAHPRPLEVEFKWLPVSGPAGGHLPYALRNQLDQFTRQGFQPVRVDPSKPEEDFREQFGYGFPPTAHVDADGTIRRGSDVALYVRDGEVARKWYAWMEEEARKAEEARPSELRAGTDTAEAYHEEEQTGFISQKRERSED